MTENRDTHSVWPDSAPATVFHRVFSVGQYSIWRQCKHVIVQVELKLLIMNNQIEFRKTLETSVDLCLSKCPLAESPTSSQCQRLNVGT